MLPDKSGRYAALYRPIHMIGLELGISVASAALRSEPTGAPTGFRSDVVATAKRDLKAARCWTARAASASGASRRRRERSLARGLLPLGLAHDVKLKRDIAEGQALDGPTWRMTRRLAVKVRREMEAAFGRRNVGAEPVL